MKSYLIVTGVVFTLITAAHVLRAVAEGPRVARDPFFLAPTALAAGLSVWAWILFRRSLKSR